MITDSIAECRIVFLNVFYVVELTQLIRLSLLDLKLPISNNMTEV